MQSTVHNAGPGAVGFAETPDAVALVEWLLRDQVIAKLNAEIDSEADDAASLSHEARQRRESEVQSDLLDIERQESALVWSAMSQSLPIEHRADCDPRAVLGIALVVAPANGPRGTSYEHVVDFAIPGRP